MRKAIQHYLEFEKQANELEMIGVKQARLKLMKLMTETPMTLPAARERLIREMMTDNINANRQRPPITDLTQPRDACNKPPHISTRRQAIAAIRAEQDAIFASRDETRGTHEASVRFCADVIIDKGERLMSQWKTDLPMDPEEFLDIANWATIALLIQRGQWTLPWEDHD